MAVDDLALIAALAGIVSAAGGALAAFAAFGSASAASGAVNQAARLERRTLVRHVVVSAHEVIAEEARISSLVDELKMQYSALFTFAGQSGGSRQTLYIDRAEQRKNEANTLQGEASRLIDESNALIAASDDDLTQTLARFDGHVVRVRSIREELQWELNSIAQQNLTYRDRALGQMRGRS
jgi:hypothetical protein